MKWDKLCPFAAVQEENYVIKILFVCHGNICRSPMAEFIMKELAGRAGRQEDFIIDSAATSAEELGNDMYPPAKKMLQEKGIPFTRRAARQIRRGDYEYYDYIIGLDSYNIRNLESFFNGDPEGKISMLLGRPVADPWYTGDFETTYDDLIEGCGRLLERL